MISLQTKLKSIRDALNTTSAQGSVYHYTRPAKTKPPYVIWAEDGENDSAEYDNHKAEQQIHGTIDCYTLTEFDPLADEIQNALNSIDVGWGLLSVQYEDETNLIHYEWEFNAV